MKKVTMSFMGVQPINLNNELYLKLITKKIKFSTLQSLSSQSSLDEWMISYSAIYDVYKDLYVWDVSDVDIDLRQDLFRDGTAVNKRNDMMKLSKYLVSHKAKLYFDPRFVYFILVYQIDFEIPYQQLNDFLDYDPTENNTEYKDLYNIVRNAIVKESSTAKISAWGNAVQRNTLYQIHHILENVYHLKVNMKDVNIVHNSCNISNFVVLPKCNDHDILIKKLFSLNIYAERLSSEVEIESLYNETVYFSFNGRFHTIVLKNEKDMYRFHPLQFHIQYMWFLVEKYYALMNGINKHLMQTDSLDILQKYAHFIHTIINKIELISLHDINFKHSIEVDIDLYEKNENKWSIPKLLEGSKQYVTFFKDYLDRLFKQKSANYQKKMNLILLGISFLQLLALISIWNDYLALLNKKNVNVDLRFLQLFDYSSDKLLTFNLYIPIGLGIIILGFGLYLWKHRIR